MLWAAALALAAPGCSSSASETVPVEFSVAIRVVDESGAPIAGASVDTGTDVHTTDASGLVPLELTQGPILAVVSGDGLLTEPIPIGRSESGTVIEVRMLSDLEGRRWSMHSGGDFMLGRRYIEPASEDEPTLLDPADLSGSAIRVVENLSRAFAAADLRTVNLESVVSNLPKEAAYPGKRFIINTPPEALSALQAIGTDVVMLGNNHTRDYLDVGVTETIAALDAIDIPFTGISDGTRSPDLPAVLGVNGRRVAVFSWTTLDGDSVNDTYPDADDPIPGDVPPEDMWLYEERTWGYASPSWALSQAPRRVGDVWRRFQEAEPQMNEADVASAWAAMIEVYPELQDWVARRGHGGASVWNADRAKAAIGAIQDSVDVVVVQFHSGYQFQRLPSDYVRRVAREAIDAGANIVIAHHPHVLQGAEWYKNRLIVYSLGNFVFDQDFLTTFPSAFLRTVWEGNQLVDARFVLLELDGYRPLPVTDRAAERTALYLWEHSIVGGYSSRDASGAIRSFLPSDPGSAEALPDTLTAHIRMRHHDAVITQTPPPTEELSFSVGSRKTKKLEYAGLLHSRMGGSGIEVGRELFGWGGFEDMGADGNLRTSTHWNVEGDNRELPVGEGSGAGIGHVRMRSTESFRGDVFIRPIARIPLITNRFFYDREGVSAPADGTANYTLRAMVKLRGRGNPYLRLDLSSFDDTNPTEDPTTDPIGRIDLPLEVRSDGKWHQVELDIPEEMLISGSKRANVMLLYARFGKPDSGESFFELDEVEVIEWRPAADMPDAFAAFDYLRNTTGSSISFTVQAMPLKDPPAAAE